MKSLGLITAALAGSLAACASPRESRIDPSGLYPDVGTGNIHREEDHSGYLRVFTPGLRVDQEGKPADPECDSSYVVASGYSIYDPEGRRVFEVANHSPLITADEGPSVVGLPPGTYLIVLNCPVGEARAFWVTVESHRLSEVDATRLGQVEIRNPRAAS